jgi:hypothetical protein
VRQTAVTSSTADKSLWGHELVCMVRSGLASVDHARCGLYDLGDARVDSIEPGHIDRHVEDRPEETADEVGATRRS